MWIESLQPLRVRRKIDVVDLQPGLPVEFDDADGQRLLARAGGKVKVVTIASAPAFPLGSLVHIRSLSGGQWVGSVALIFFQSSGGTTKTGWWYCVEAGARWSFVHESLLDFLTTRNVEVGR